MTHTAPAQPADLTASPAIAPLTPLIVLLFVGSGAAALIYEIVWLQLLQLHIGSSAVSLGVLLSTFMGGMCAGSLLLPRFIPTSRHPLRVYALLELGIGSIGLLELLIMPALADGYAHSTATGWTSIMLRGLVAGIALLPATMLMGATLPAVARYVHSTPRGVSWLGFFYAGNIAGAVIGCLLAGLYLLPRFDMPTASIAAAAINATIALLAWSLSLAKPHHPATSTAAPATPTPRVGPRTIYCIIALSGLTGLGAEVVWTRMLSLLLGGTVYTFSNILAVFLVGLGIGSGVGAFTARRIKSPRLALGLCQLLLMVAIAWAAYAMTYALPFWNSELRVVDSPIQTLQLDLLRACWVVLPGALLWGASFPLALAAAAGPAQDAGKLVGRVYAANTLGGIFGSLLFSVLIIPHAGTQGAQQLLIALCALSALIACAPALLAPPKRALGYAALAGMALSALVMVLTIPPPNWGAVAFGRRSAWWQLELYPANQLTLEEIDLLQQANAGNMSVSLKDGQAVIDDDATPDAHAFVDAHRAALTTALNKGLQMRRGNDQASARSFGNGAADPKIPTRYCAYVGEGINFSVAVSFDPQGYRYYHGAGKVQASTLPEDMRLQRTLGHIAALTHNNPKSVLVVACGAGVTAGSFVPYDSVRNITICDIERMVPDNVADRFFSFENYGVIRDPRTRVVIDDGRHFIKTTRETFDIITSDPVDPWVKGCAALNTVEYYQMCNARLNPGGVIALWIPLYEMSEDTARSLIATFFKVFPNSGMIWSNDTNGEGYDVILFGRANDVPAPINLDAMQDWLDLHPRVRQSLRDVGYGREDGPGEAVELCATFAGDAAHLAPWTGTTDRLINYDRNLRLQYIAGLSLNEDHAPLIFSHMLRYYQFPDATFAGSSDASLSALKTLLQSTGRK